MRETVHGRICHGWAPLPLAYGVVLAAALATAMPALAQQAKPAGGIPNLTGFWGHNGFGYRVPFINRDGSVIDAHRNEYLKPWTAEAVIRDHFAERAGRLIPTPHTTCYPDGIPTVFALREMQIQQTPTKVLLIFVDDHQTRHVYLDRQHPANVTPSWYGDSVGHYEGGDTLVVDTIGVSVNPQARLDRYGTPHSHALHIIERFRVLPRAAVNNEIVGRPGANLNNQLLPKLGPNTTALQLVFTVEDPIALKKPYSVTLEYQPIASAPDEQVCAENNRDWAVLIPTADKPDF